MNNNSAINNAITYTIAKLSSVDYGRTFYGPTFLAATLSLKEEKIDIQKKLIKNFVQREKRESTHHQEFNYYALQHIDPTIIPKALQSELMHPHFEQFFFRKVSNWVLLRSLVRIRTKSKLNKLIGIVQAIIILTFNHEGGYITDNTLRSWHKRKSSKSSQYHAFATMLVGELYLETKLTFFKKRFTQGLALSRSEIQRSGKAILHGRGRQQIFGYAALLYALSIGYQITNQPDLRQDFKCVLKYVLSFQKDSGEIPLVLVTQNPEEYLHSYNNSLDYLPFLLYYIVRGHVL